MEASGVQGCESPGQALVTVVTTAAVVSWPLTRVCLLGAGLGGHIGDLHNSPASCCHSLHFTDGDPEAVSLSRHSLAR